MVMFYTIRHSNFNTKCLVPSGDTDYVQNSLKIDMAVSDEFTILCLCTSDPDIFQVSVTSGYFLPIWSNLYVFEVSIETGIHRYIVCLQLKLVTFWYFFNWLHLHWF